MIAKSFRKFSLLICILFICTLCPIVTSAYGTPTGALYNNGIYRIRNVKTNHCLAVVTTSPSNGKNIVHAAYSANDTKQQFRMDFDINSRGASLHVMCSGGGFGRSLDVQRKGKKTAEDKMNVQVWRREMPTEDNSQQWYFIEGSTTLSVIIAPASNPDVALTAVGTAAGGTNTGTGSDSSGNVCVKTRVDGDKSQEWYLELVKHLSETPNTTIAAMTTRFPAGRYWNHEGLSTNNPGGTTNQHCVHAHGNCGNGGHCTCNVESGAIQCAGYSNKVIKDAYGGYYYSLWPLRYVQKNGASQDVRPGDVIRTSDHWLVVWKAGALTTAKCTDCNWGGTRSASNRCIIRWDATKYGNVDRVYCSPYTWS